MGRMPKPAGRAAAVAALALAGCGEPQGTGRLEVDKVLTGSPGFMEGSLTEVTVRDEQGRTVLEQRQREPGQRAILARSLPAGDYTLVARERPCQGNCGMLDPPAGECELDLDVEPDAATRVVVQLAGTDLECDAR